jgi:hypothetical protein
MLKAAVILYIFFGVWNFAGCRSSVVETAIHPNPVIDQKSSDSEDKNNQSNPKI